METQTTAGSGLTSAPANTLPLPQPLSPGARRAAGVLAGGVHPHYNNRTVEHYNPPYYPPLQHQQSFVQYALPPQHQPSSHQIQQQQQQPSESHHQLHYRQLSGSAISPSNHQHLPHHRASQSPQSTQTYPLPTTRVDSGYSPNVFSHSLPLPNTSMYSHLPPQHIPSSVSTSASASVHPPPAPSVGSSKSATSPQSPIASTSNIHQNIADTSPAIKQPSNTLSEETSKSSTAKRSFSNSAGNASSSKKKQTRRYNASCDACRARKRKCPGRDSNTGKTLCTACGDRGVVCTYGSLGEPSRLRRADNENEKLRTIIASALSAESAHEKDDILATITERMLAASAGGGGSSSGGGSGKGRRNSDGASDEVAATMAKRFRLEQDEDSESNASVTLPSSSKRSATTAFESAPAVEMEDDTVTVNAVPSPRHSSDEETVAQFTQAPISAELDRGQGDTELERQMSLYVSFALPQGDNQSGPMPHEDQRLVDFYFSWLNPRYALLSESLFRKSRQSGDGVFCTPLLLWSLYAHSASHCPGFEDKRTNYRARAHLLLTKELCKGKAATLATAQGLILLAGTAAARSDHSLAWTLTFTVTGMVIDLLEDMGPSITEEEKMMRKRLYWSQYIWSIVVALNLNRKPSVPKLKVELPQGQDETKLWRAALPIRSGMNAPHLQNLTIPRQAHELECFRNTCQLFSFMDEILSNVYVAAHEKKSPEAINSSVRCIRDRMISWQSSQISSNILIDPQNLPTLCPPPHIIHFNLLLRSSWILLYRPFYNMGSRRKSPITGARQACNQCASEIYTIFSFFEQNFGNLQLHFSYIYAAYWAATIDVAAARREGLTPDLLSRLRNSSRILLTWVSLPGMKQSVSDLIAQIEALLLADVPPQPTANEPYAAYDPMQNHQVSQDVNSHTQPPPSQPYQMQDLLKPEQQGLMLTEPMLGITSPGDYASIGELYWDPAWANLW